MGQLLSLTHSLYLSMRFEYAIVLGIIPQFSPDKALDVRTVALIGHPDTFP